MTTPSTSDQDQDDTSPAPLQSELLEAAGAGNLEQVEILLSQAQAHINPPVSHQETPLSQAARHGHYEIVKLLLEHQADVDRGSQSGRSPLSWAASQGHLDILKLLLEYKANVNQQEPSGWTPLLWACRNPGPPEIVQELMQHGALASLVTHDGGTTPFAVAAGHGRCHTVRTMLQHGVHVDMPDRHGNTALHWAAKQAQLSVLKLLLQHGANINATNHNGASPLLLAAHLGRQAVLEELLHQRADPNLKNAQDESPLLLALRSQHFDVVLPLLQHQAQVDNAVFAQVLASSRGALFAWLDQDTARTILDLSTLEPHSPILVHWYWIVTLLWYHFEADESPPTILQDTRNLTRDEFLSKYKWMVYAAASLMARDHRLWHALVRIYTPDLALQTLQTKTPLLWAMDMFPTERDQPMAIQGLLQVVHWNPLALKQGRLPLAVALEQSVPLDAILELLRLWPEAIQRVDPKHGLPAFWLAASNPHYSIQDFYTLARNVLPDQLQAVVRANLSL